MDMSSEGRVMAFNLFKEYIQDDSTNEINISASLKQRVREAMFEDPKKMEFGDMRIAIAGNVFNEAFEEVLNLLERNFMKKYAGSKYEQDANRAILWCDCVQVHDIDIRHAALRYLHGPLEKPTGDPRDGSVFVTSLEALRRKFQ